MNGRRPGASLDRAHPGRDPSRNARDVLLVLVAHPRLEQLFFPPHNRVVFESERDEDDDRHPHGVRAEREAGPKEDIAGVERVAHDGEGAGRDERPKTVAARARDDADVSNCPESDELAGCDQRNASCVDDARMSELLTWKEEQRQRQRHRDRGPVPEEPAAGLNPRIA